jgi:hypothetical protein
MLFYSLVGTGIGAATLGIITLSIMTLRMAQHSSSSFLLNVDCVIIILSKMEFSIMTLSNTTQSLLILSIMVLTIMTLRIMTFSITISE